MIHPAIALGIGLLIAICVFAYGASSGPQADTGYWAGEDIGAYTPSYGNGYETIDTTYSGDDIGSDFGFEGF